MIKQHLCIQYVHTLNMLENIITYCRVKFLIQTPLRSKSKKLYLKFRGDITVFRTNNSISKILYNRNTFYTIAYK